MLEVAVSFLRVSSHSCIYFGNCCTFSGEGEFSSFHILPKDFNIYACNLLNAENNCNSLIFESWNLYRYINFCCQLSWRRFLSGNLRIFFYLYQSLWCSLPKGWKFRDEILHLWFMNQRKFKLNLWFKVTSWIRENSN